MAIFSNSATLSYNGTSTTSNTVTGTLQEILTVEKIPVVNSYKADDTVTYVITMVNSGASNLTNLTLVDDLGGYTFDGSTLYPMDYVAGSIKYLVDGLQVSAPTVSAGPPLQITGFTVPANGNTMIIYETTVNEYAPLDVAGSILNTVVVAGGGLSEPVVATATIATVDAPDLSIIKSLCPTVVTDNSQLTYTFTIQNTGNTPADASSDIVLTDTFEPKLTSITVTFNGTTWTDPTNYDYDPDTGIFETVAGEITVPAATYTQDPATGVWTVTPGESILIVTGTV